MLYKISEGISEKGFHAFTLGYTRKLASCGFSQGECAELVSIVEGYMQLNTSKTASSDGSPVMDVSFDFDGFAKEAAWAPLLGMAARFGAKYLPTMLRAGGGIARGASRAGGMLARGAGSVASRAPQWAQRGWQGAKNMAQRGWRGARGNTGGAPQAATKAKPGLGSYADSALTASHIAGSLGGGTAGQYPQQGYGQYGQQYLNQGYPG